MLPDTGREGDQQALLITTFAHPVKVENDPRTSDAKLRPVAPSGRGRPTLRSSPTILFPDWAGVISGPTEVPPGLATPNA